MSRSPTGFHHYVQAAAGPGDVMSAAGNDERDGTSAPLTFVSLGIWTWRTASLFAGA